MPPLSEQIAMPGSYTTDFALVRALLRQGRPYEEAVAQFAPYREVKDVNQEGRDALRAVIRRMREERRAAYIFVNNRFEGNAPETVRAVTASEAPIDSLLPEILDRLSRSPNLVIEAPPGAGKTTRVPAALLPAIRGKILVLEPRRIAAAWPRAGWPRKWMNGLARPSAIRSGLRTSRVRERACVS